MVVQTFIQAGADVNARTAQKVTPLMLSLDMAFGQPDIALALIRAGADVNAADQNGDTPLIIATTESSFEAFKVLSDKGANPNARGLNGNSALHYAAMNAMIDRAKLLLQHGADPALRNAGGATPYDVAETTNDEKSVRAKFGETRRLLLQALQAPPKHASVNN